MTAPQPYSTPFSEWKETYLSDPDEAQAYLEVALEEYEQDHDREMFVLALRAVANAQGGIGRLAERTGLNRENLYRALSKKGNPRLDTIGRILNGLGFRLALAPVDRDAERRSTDEHASNQRTRTV
jgi:probable addiction module antidote protein